ncbi:MAG: hypothetical protein WC505_06905 [Patescibacteria group bacterium]
MILEVSAEYDAATDVAQVATIVQTDAGVSAADQVESGVVELLQGSAAQYSAAFNYRDVVLIENDGQYSDVGRFYTFVLHPNMQKHMTARCTVTLNNGDTATRVVPVNYRYVGSTMPTLNPLFGGVENYDFEQTPDKP